MRIGFPLLNRLKADLHTHTHRDLKSKKLQNLTISQLNFVPLESVSGQAAIVATINASTEGLSITADRISIAAATSFAAGYDPTDKVDEEGGSYDSAASGARVRIFPDSNTGIQVIDDAANDVFKVMVGGADVGDVTIGNYAGSQGVKWDKSAGTFDIKGSMTAGAISGITLSIGAGNDIFKVDANGNVWWGHTNLSSAVAKILKTGVATLTKLTAVGTLTSASGTGERIIISPTEVKFYNDDNVNTGRISGGPTGTSALHFKVGTNIKLLLEAAQLQLRFGTALWINDSDNSDYIRLQHDGSRGIMAVTGNQNLWFQGGGGFIVRDGGILQAKASNNTDYIQLRHDGDNAFIEVVDPPINVQIVGGSACNFNLKYGGYFKAYNAANTHYCSLHQDTTNNAYVGNTSGGGFLWLRGNGGTTDIYLRHDINSLRPADNELCYLGTNSNEWKEIWAADTSVNHADIAEKLKVAPQYKLSKTELKFKANKRAENLDVIKKLREKDFSNLRMSNPKNSEEIRKPTKEEQEAEREKQIRNVIKMESDYFKTTEIISKIPFGSVVVITKDGIVPSEMEDDYRYAGVISENPGVKIGSKKKGPFVAFGGVVSCRVIGKVKAGQTLTTAPGGCAQYSANPKVGALVGKALEDKETTDEGLIDIWVK